MHPDRLAAGTVLGFFPVANTETIPPGSWLRAYIPCTYCISYHLGPPVGQEVSGVSCNESINQSRAWEAAINQAWLNCLDTGRLQPGWALCRMTPIHKGESPTLANNYRGIAAGSVLANWGIMYTYIIMYMQSIHECKPK